MGLFEFRISNIDTLHQIMQQITMEMIYPLHAFSHSEIMYQWLSIIG